MEEKVDGNAKESYHICDRSDYAMVASAWLRESETKIMIPEYIPGMISSWCEVVRSVYIENRWRPNRDDRFGLYLDIFNDWGVLSTHKAIFQLVPAKGDATNEHFYIRHWESGLFLSLSNDRQQPHIVTEANKKSIDERWKLSLQPPTDEKEQLRNMHYLLNESQHYNHGVFSFSGFWLRLYPPGTRGGTIADNSPVIFHDVDRYMSTKGSGVDCSDKKESSMKVSNDILVRSKQEYLQKKREKHVQLWLEELGLDFEYFQLFLDNGFDRMRLVVEMTAADLKEIGIRKLGHRKLLDLEIKKLRSRSDV